MKCLLKRCKSSNYKVIEVNRKNPIATSRFGRCVTKFKYYLGVGFLREGNEGIDAKGGARRSLPPPDGRI
jgi:hypothetical protein